MTTKKMNILGIGPLLAIVGGFTVAILVLLKNAIGLSLALPSDLYMYSRILAVLFVIIGLYFWLSSAIHIKKAFRLHTLATSGVFALSRNPMYAAFIVFLVPAIALFVNELFILVISLAMYIAFKYRLRKEEEYLLQEFGNAFQQYAKEVPQLIPFSKMFISLSSSSSSRKQ